MKIEKIMGLNYSNKIHKIILKHELKKTKWFDESEISKDVSLLKMQRMIGSLQRKYDFNISYNRRLNGIYGSYWMAKIFNFNEGLFLNIEANTLYELFVKLCIIINYEIVNKKINERC